LLKRLGPKWVVAHGALPNPAEIQLVGNQTLLQIIGRAGSFAFDADVSHVTVVRHSSGGTPMVLVLDLRKALTGAAPQADIPMLPGDVVYVPSLNGKAPPSNLDIFGGSSQPEQTPQ
jgi:protein involved in polysaccharide export with SLBB domain